MVGREAADGIAHGGGREVAIAVTVGVAFRFCPSSRASCRLSSARPTLMADDRSPSFRRSDWCCTWSLSVRWWSP